MEYIVIDDPMEDPPRHSLAELKVMMDEFIGEKTAGSRSGLQTAATTPAKPFCKASLP